MRKTFITIALFAVLGSLVVSCQKENIIDATYVVAENGTVHTVSYTVDGLTHQITLVGDETWRDFLNRMMDLAEDGHEVTFRNEEATSRVVSTKKVVTYTTDNGEDALNWAEKMVDNGYTVTITFDKEKKVYNCYAIK